RSSIPAAPTTTHELTNRSTDVERLVKATFCLVGGGDFGTGEVPALVAQRCSGCDGADAESLRRWWRPGSVVGTRRRGWGDGATAPPRFAGRNRRSATRRVLR